MAREWKFQKVINAVWDVLVEYREGVTKPFIADLVHVKEWEITRAIREIRQIGKRGKETFTIICRTNGMRKKWLYQLVDAHVVVDEEHPPYMNTRISDCFEREKTILGVARAAVADTDGRSREGRMARLIFNHFDHGVRQTKLVQEIFNFDGQ